MAYQSTEEAAEFKEASSPFNKSGDDTIISSLGQSKTWSVAITSFLRCHRRRTATAVTHAAPVFKEPAKQDPDTLLSGDPPSRDSQHQQQGVLGQSQQNVVEIHTVQQIDEIQEASSREKEETFEEHAFAAPPSVVAGAGAFVPAVYGSQLCHNSNPIPESQEIVHVPNAVQQDRHIRTHVDHEVHAHVLVAWQQGRTKHATSESQTNAESAIVAILAAMAAGVAADEDVAASGKQQSQRRLRESRAHLQQRACLPSIGMRHRPEKNHKQRR